MNKAIRVQIEGRDVREDVGSVRVVVANHYTIEVSRDEELLSVKLLYTHHGVKGDATVVDGEFEAFINVLREQFPDCKVD